MIMEFDIQYLLFLQELRNATGNVFNEFFNAISKLAVDVMIYLPYLLFWGYSKKWGYRFIGTLWGAEMMNGIIKLTACVYRPWIRSELIEPAGDSKVAATGYSFPSGHTTVATAMYGTAFIWQKDKNRAIANLCIAGIVLTAFSRNFLGVHTPQDVAVGLVSTTILLVIAGKLQAACEKDGALADKLTMAGVALVIAALCYINFKSYPMDYVDGVLLVDPKVMMKDTFRGCGGFLGFLIGSYIERHYVHYEIPFESKNLTLLTGVGLGIIFSWHNFFAAGTFEVVMGKNWGGLITRCISGLFVLVIWPAVIMKFAKKSNAGK